jgi:hypothetical protein
MPSQLPQLVSRALAEVPILLGITRFRVASLAAFVDILISQHHTTGAQKKS